MEIALCFPASMLHVHRVALPEKTCKWLFVELLGLPWGFFSLCWWVSKQLAQPRRS